MATSALRIRFEAWANRRFLNRAIATQNSAKLAAGVLMFMAFRQMLSRRLGKDYLVAMPDMPREDSATLLRSVKGVYMQMFLTEAQLRKVQGNAHYDQVCGGTQPDPFAHRLAASIAIQMVSAQLVAAPRAQVVQCLDALLAAAMTELPNAYLAARATLDLQREMATEQGTSVDDILGHVEHLTLEDLEQPLSPAPAWLLALRATTKP
jgi:hypothetical protein